MPAKFRVSITRAAESDIEQAWSFIAQDSPETANEFISRLEEQIETLEIFPNRCAALIPENEILGTRYRHMIYGDYRTVFRVAKRTVYVLRVILGARLLDASMFEEME
jgi:toxin ParE1/3/4